MEKTRRAVLASFVTALAGGVAIRPAAAQPFPRFPPPPPEGPRPPPPPGPPGRVAWEPGHWQWDPRPRQYIWIGGHWVERRGGAFEPGHWSRNGAWIPPHWR